MVKKNKIDLKKAFIGLQKEMAAKLGTARTVIGHPVAKGDVTENSWRELLSKYLPKRYAVEKAFIVDFQGNISDQIDLVIFDRHFSPFMFHRDGALYIPAESVYAIFEIKQTLGKKEIKYAGKKAESVRKLKRTSSHITHAGGRHDPIVPRRIIAGFLCLTSDWKTGIADQLKNGAKSMRPDEPLDIVCTLEHGAFNLTYGKKKSVAIEMFPPEQALIHFFLALLLMLQSIGSVPAMDLAAYRKSLK